MRANSSSKQIPVKNVFKLKDLKQLSLCKMLYLLLAVFLVNSFLFGGVVGICLYLLLLIVCGRKAVTRKEDVVFLLFCLISSYFGAYVVWAVCITVQTIVEDLIFSKR